jgi:hypothetical protein
MCVLVKKKKPETTLSVSIRRFLRVCHQQNFERNLRFEDVRRMLNAHFLHEIPESMHGVLDISKTNNAMRDENIEERRKQKLGSNNNDDNDNHNNHDNKNNHNY